jgi:poly(hydroxyalkanoate) granule-associated protein
MATRKPAAARHSLPDGKFADAIRQSAHQIWMAGLGAFGKAQKESDTVFDKLVREGRAIQKRTMALTEEKMLEVSGRLDEVSNRVAKVAGKMQREATERWDQLESVFESRVERALRRLGMPTTAEIRTLTQRVEQLTANVQKASARKPAVKSGAKSGAKQAQAAATKKMNQAVKTVKKAARKAVKNVESRL